MAWYKEMFANEDPARFDRYVESDTSRRQVDFIIDKCALEPGAKVLDLCCGQGRHLVDLARRGYDVVGQDLSEYMLESCKTAAATEGVNPVLVHADMRQIGYTSEFDAIINMFTSFGYLETEDEDQKVLKAASLALKGGGSLLLDMLNRDWFMSVFTQTSWHETDRGDLVLSERKFDSRSGHINGREITIHEDGSRTDNSHSLRLYTYNEIEKMLQQAGLTIKSSYGDFDSSPLDHKSRRMILVANKPR